MVTTTAREENGEFCVAVAPVTSTAGILITDARAGYNYDSTTIRPPFDCSSTALRWTTYDEKLARSFVPQSSNDQHCYIIIYYKLDTIRYILYKCGS